jgi:hypothetical protein
MVTTKEFGLTRGARSKYRELFHNIVNGMDPVPRLQPSEIVCSLFDTVSKALAQTLNMNELPKWFTGGAQTVLKVCGAERLSCAVHTPSYYWSQYSSWWRVSSCQDVSSVCVLIALNLSILRQIAPNVV